MVYRVLVVDDEPNMRDVLSDVLTDQGYEVAVAADGAEAIARTASQDFHVVVIDLKLPDRSGIEVLRAVRARAPETACIMITAYSSVETAIEAMKCGAYDYITKPFKIDNFKMVVRNALDLVVSVPQGPRRSGTRPCDDLGMVGSTPQMREILAMIDDVAPTNATVLIYGETGTGKELLARAIHARSLRADRPLIKVNCAAVPEGLLESELFGHERGAFTSAVVRRLGRFEVADTGTIFLDEVGEMSPAMQAKLLRVTQEREFERVGSSQTVRVDVRIIAATNQDLKERVARGAFREDLYYRLSVVPIYLPPLRERKGDIPLLVEKFVSCYSEALGRRVTRVSDEAMKLLMAYDWPGNIRELENCIERAVIFAKGTVIGADSLYIGIPAVNSGGQAGAPDVQAGLGKPRSIKEVERAHILQVLSETNRNRTEAARILKISRRTLLNKIKEYGIAD